MNTFAHLQHIAGAVTTKTQPVRFPIRSHYLTCLAFLLVNFGFVSSVCPQTETRDAKTKVLDFSQSLASLKETWRDGNIERVQIIHIPPGTHFPVHLSPERLENWCMFKLVVREPKDQRLTQALFDKLEKVSAEGSEEPDDMRWGITFFD